MGRLFGTDGARGVANRELTCELALNIGRAAAMVLTENKKNDTPKVLIGKDTRISSDMLEGALTAGLCSIGVDVVLLGAIPTPAVAYLIRQYHADAGIMISASHNQFQDNGIKLFSGEGYKLPDRLEEQIESIVLDGSKPFAVPEGAGIGRVCHAEHAAEEYINHVIESVPERFDGIRVAIDCSNGSASTTAEKLFTRLGAECFMLADKPDGININDGCGSTHLEMLQKYVREHDVQLGVAFDGDADRCLAVDENGNIVDGDMIIAACAKDLAERGKLHKNMVVGTIMSNMGLSCFCADNHLGFVAADVGDRYVLEEMLRNGYNFGGEQSGHVIFLDYSTTGDGQMTAAQLISLVCRKNKKLSEIVACMTKYPQALRNVLVTQEGKENLKTNEVIQRKTAEVTELLGSDGRILVRPSGTEKIVRVMLEGLDEKKIKQLADETAALIKQTIGSE